MISNYSELQTAVGNWLNRSDLTARIPEFIALAEKRMRRDKRLREISTLEFTAAEDYGLPPYFKAVQELYLDDGSNYFNRMIEVGAAELAERKRRHGNLGQPHWFAVIETSSGRTLRFAPQPSGTYKLQLIYETELDALSTSNTSNWLLAAAEDLYLWASLSVAEGYLQEDERVGLWKSEYEQAADEYLKDKKHRQFGGPLIPRPSSIIGEDV